MRRRKFFVGFRLPTASRNVDAAVDAGRGSSRPLPVDDMIASARDDHQTLCTDAQGAAQAFRRELRDRDGQAGGAGVHSEQEPVPATEPCGIRAGMVEDRRVGKGACLIPLEKGGRSGQVEKHPSPGCAREERLAPKGANGVRSPNLATLDVPQRWQANPGRVNQHHARRPDERLIQPPIERAEHFQRQTLHSRHSLRGELAIDVDHGCQSLPGQGIIGQSVRLTRKRPSAGSRPPKRQPHEPATSLASEWS
jgi:hypothetical protein